MRSERLLETFRLAVRAYPKDFRDEFGADMLQVLGDQLRAQEGSPGAQLATVGRALADVARTAPRQRLSAEEVSVAAAAGSGAALAVAVDRMPRGNPTRRDFLRASLALAGVGFGASVGGASLAFLWPSLRDGFGAVVDIGSVEEVSASVAGAGGTWAVPHARSYIVAYDPADDAGGEYAELTAGAPFMALYQRCVHLGCRVPWCTASTRFECPCHKSRYNRWGEWQDGPAPRGLDRFNVTVAEDRVRVDTRTIVTGPPRNAGVLSEPASGPSCLGAA